MNPEKILAAAKEALAWLEEAPIEELEAVEHAIEKNAPMAALKEAIMELENNRCNGWTNKETWYIWMHISNNVGQRYYQLYLDHVKQYIQEAKDSQQVKDGIWTVEEARRFNVADYVERRIKDEINMQAWRYRNKKDLTAQMAEMDLMHVNWEELADRLIDVVGEVSQ